MKINDTLLYYVDIELRRRATNSWLFWSVITTTGGTFVIHSILSKYRYLNSLFVRTKIKLLK